MVDKLVVHKLVVHQPFQLPKSTTVYQRGDIVKPEDEHKVLSMKQYARRVARVPAESLGG